MSKQKKAMEKEISRLEKQESKFINKRMEKSDTAINRLLDEKIPAKLQGTLDAAFSKAFALIFEKGTGVIEKGYNREKRETQFKIDEFTARIKGDRKSLRTFSKKAGGSGNVNLTLSGAAGIGMGVLGIGIPDIAVFTGFMLKSIYEIAMSYGYSYDSDIERQFILRIIRGGVAFGDELLELDAELNYFIKNGVFPAESIDSLIKEAAEGLSKELLYMKFLQGIPVVGAIGGAYDAIYIKRINHYAELKYRRRFYTELGKPVPV